MANILNGWRFRVLMLIVLVLPISIRTMMHHPAYVDRAVQVSESLEERVPPQVGDDATPEQREED